MELYSVVHEDMIISGEPFKTKEEAVEERDRLQRLHTSKVLGVTVTVAEVSLLEGV